MAIDRAALRVRAEAPTDDPASALTGVWQNELGSLMTVTSASGTSFSGTYESTVSSGGGAISGTLQGQISGTALSFSVCWHTQSVSSWTGVLLEDGSTPVIYALWQLAETPEGSTWWSAINAGCDFFIPFEA